MLFLASDIISTAKGRPLVSTCFSSRAVRRVVSSSRGMSHLGKCFVSVNRERSRAINPWDKTEPRAGLSSILEVVGPTPLPVTEACLLICENFPPFLALIPPLLI